MQISCRCKAVPGTHFLPGKSVSARFLSMIWLANGQNFPPFHAIGSAISTPYRKGVIFLAEAAVHDIETPCPIFAQITESPKPSARCARAAGGH
ncbi:MAG TPA: hypothetical protein VMA37_12040 [Acetobacteraceae bacterium]|nr:hypothetical protein [Acetobacteraceae bacterium]